MPQKDRSNDEKECSFPLYRLWLREVGRRVGEWWIDITSQQSIVGQAQLIHFPPGTEINRKSRFIGMPSVSGVVVPGDNGPDSPSFSGEEKKLEKILQANQVLEEAGGTVKKRSRRT